MEKIKTKQNKFKNGIFKETKRHSNFILNYHNSNTIKYNTRNELQDVQQKGNKTIWREQILNGK